MNRNVVGNRLSGVGPAEYRPAPPDGLISPPQKPYYGYWRSYGHPGDGLTPRRVVAIFRAAECGQPQAQCDLFEDIVENDGHLESIINSRSDAVCGKEWMIQAQGDDPEDTDAAAALAESLAGAEGFAEMVEHQLTSAGYGYAGTEMQWGLGPAGLVAPIWFYNTAHRQFVFDAADEPRVLVNGDEYGYGGVPLEPGRFFFSRRRHRLAVRAGYLRNATWWALFKRMDMRDWVQFMTRFGIPFVLGTYRDDMPEPEKEAVRKAVELIGRDGYAAFSEAGKIEFAKAEFSSGADVHPALAAFCNAELSKLVTGATLTTGEGTSTGSYALGRVHENVSFNIIANDAKRLGDWFALQVAKPFMLWNRMPGRPPRLRIHVVRETDPLGRMEVWSRALNECGVEGDEDQFRQEFQIRAPSGQAVKGTKAAVNEKNMPRPSEPGA